MKRKASQSRSHNSLRLHYGGVSKAMLNVRAGCAKTEYGGIARVCVLLILDENRLRPQSAGDPQRRQQQSTGDSMTAYVLSRELLVLVREVVGAVGAVKRWPITS